MESLLARKSRPSLRVEPLEDRRILSLFGAPPAWEAIDRPVDSQFETAPLVGGRGDSSPDNFASPEPDRDESARPESSRLDLQNTPETATSLPTTCGPTTASLPDPNPASAGISTRSAPDPVEGANPGGLASENTPSPSNAPLTATENNPAARAPGSDSSASVPASIPLVLPPRASASFSTSRSTTELETTSARSETTPSPSTPARSVEEGTFLAQVTANPSLTEVATSPEQARSQVGTSLPIGAGLLTGQGSSVLVVTPSKGSVELPESPIGQDDASAGIEGRAGGVETRSEGPSSVRFDHEVPEPQLAGMIQSFLPFDRAAMESAIDRFLEPFDGLASTMPELRGPMGWITASLTAAATVVAVEVAIRLRRARQENLGVDDADGLTIRPGAWS